MQSALERAVPAKNWLRNIPVFITSNSCGKGKGAILDPASSTSRLQRGWESRELPAQPCGPAGKERKTCVIFQRAEPALTRWGMYEPLTEHVLAQGSLVSAQIFPQPDHPWLPGPCSQPGSICLCSVLSAAQQGGQREGGAVLCPSFLGWHRKANWVCSAGFCC